MPAEVLVSDPVRATPGGRSIPWLVLRWGTMAAILGVLTVIAILRPGIWNWGPEVSKLTPPPAPASPSLRAPQTVLGPSSALPPAPAVPAEAPSEEQESAGKLAAVGKPSSAQRDLTLAGPTARPPASQQVTIMASSRPPAEFRAEHGMAVQAAREESKGGNTLTVVASPEPSPPPGPPAAPVPATAEADKSIAAQPKGPATSGATNANVTVTVSAERLQTTTATVSTLGGFTAAKAAPHAGAQAARRMAPQASMHEMAASRKKVEVQAAPRAAFWNVSPDGQVQRSTDGGKTFSSIPVATGIKFMAIAAVGDDVWAGGAGGALYHSANGGATWNSVGISFAGKPITEMVTGIQVTDPQHLTVTMASGSQWASDDGVQSWQRKP